MKNRGINENQYVIKYSVFVAKCKIEKYEG